MTCPRCFLPVLLAALFAPPLYCTGPTGMVVGTVSDPSGAVVAEAQVTVRHIGTNAARVAKTDTDGNYAVTLLPPGQYQVTAERTGFRRASYNGVKVDVDQTVRVDFALQLGEVTQEVVVEEPVPLIQTDTSALGQVVDQVRVSQLPLDERNFLTFALLVPGAQLAAEGSQNSTQGGALSVNGAREQSNNFLLDGVDNNDLYINQYTVLPSVDAIQEFKVESGNYSAEFGRSGGAQVNIALKSGTNQVHGGLFEYLRNRHLDAKNFFDQPDCASTSVPGTCAEIPRFDRNQFGGTLGGPIHRDTTFFFVSYEGLRLRQATTRQATVPSQVERQFALMAVPPAFRNPAGEAVFNLFPAANVGPNLATSNLFVASPAIRNSVNLGLVRVDQYFGRNDTLSGHYTIFQEHRFNPYDPLNEFTNLPGYGSFSKNRGQNVAISLTHIFNSRWLNDFRFGFNRLRAGIFQEHSGDNINQQLGFPTVLTNPVDFGFPNVEVLGYDGFGEPINYPQDRKDNTFHWVENLAWNPGGSHQIRMGADIRYFRLNSFLDFLARGDWFFLDSGSPMPNPVAALAQLLAGFPDFAVAAQGNTDNGLRTTSWNFYFQDDIRLRPRFTLNVGLRYEYNSPTVEVEDRFSVPDLSANSLTCTPQPDCQFIRAGTQGIPRATYDKDLNNFAPRIGFAWRPLASERFVIRSAYGIFYDQVILNANIFPRFNPPFYAVTFFPNSGTNVIQDILNQPGFAFVQPNMMARNFRSGYMQQWNLNMQYELRPNWVLDLAYVGSKGTNLAATRDLNQPRPGAPFGPFPQFSSILVIESRASSIYHSLQLRSEKRFTRGLAFLAAYTWSRSIDDASAVFGSGVTSGLPQDSQNPIADRGLSDFHTQHRFVLSYIYELPFGTGRHWLSDRGVLTAVLGQWQVAGILSVQTGHPFTVNRGSTASQTSLTAFGISDRPDVLADPFQPGPVTANPDPACQTTRSQGGLAADRVRVPESWFNPCAFADPSPTRFGTTGRNTLVAPGLANFDIAIAKDIPLWRENHRLQLRADFFNLFNHPNFDAPSRTLGSATFGSIGSANAFGNKPPRQIQIGLKYVF